MSVWADRIKRFGRLARRGVFGSLSVWLPAALVVFLIAGALGLAFSLPTGTFQYCSDMLVRCIKDIPETAGGFERIRATGACSYHTARCDLETLHYSLTRCTASMQSWFALTEEYNKVGHVPYKEKDKLYEAYHEVLDRIYKELNISTKRRRLNDFKANIKNVAKRGEEALDNERGRLARRFEQLKQEIQTYENNLGFLNASSKNGNSLIDEMNRKVQHLRDDLELVRQKIKAIDAENK